MNRAPTFVTLCFGACALGLASADTPETGTSVMIIAGITAEQEACLVVENGNFGTDNPIVLQDCAAAIAAGDGRELWQRQANGHLSSPVGGYCLGVKGSPRRGAQVVLSDCGEATNPGSHKSEWVAGGTGQLNLASDGSLCLSQDGSSFQLENIALKAAAAASSSINIVDHGVNKAVDGKEATYWASRPGRAESTTVTVDLGAVYSPAYAEITWTFPPKSFKVLLSTDGEKWVEVFSTVNNLLKSTRFQLGYRASKFLRIVMLEAHPVLGVMQGNSLYGISGIGVYASQMRSIVDDCEQASHSKDARDKYFFSQVVEADLNAAQALRGEVPSLEAASVSLAGICNDLQETILHAPLSCHGAAALSDTSRRELVLASNVSTMSLRAERRSHSADDHKAMVAVKMPLSKANRMQQVAEMVEAQNNIDRASLSSLMTETRLAIIHARQALASAGGTRN